MKLGDYVQYTGSKSVCKITEVGTEQFFASGPGGGGCWHDKWRISAKVVTDPALIKVWDDERLELDHERAQEIDFVLSLNRASAIRYEIVDLVRLLPPCKTKKRLGCNHIARCTRCLLDWKLSELRRWV